MFTFEVSIAITIAVANAIAVATFVYFRTRGRTTSASPTKEQATASVDPLDTDSAHILALITRSHDLTTREERLKNAQELYEYLVLHPTILLQPRVRDVVQRKATETLRVLQQDNTLPYPFIVHVQRTMDAFVFTLQAIRLLPEYVL
jgi:hypothetical protein